MLKPLRYYQTGICFQETPGNISLFYEFTGCPFKCPGCHSPHLIKERSGVEFDFQKFRDTLEEYHRYVTCLLCMGGDWNLEILTQVFKEAKMLGLRTALYTGSEVVPEQLKSLLTYCKTGPYIKALGGLSSPKTNQRFLNLETGEDLTPLFRRN